jgi:hypothetical protein
MANTVTVEQAFPSDESDSDLLFFRIPQPACQADFCLRLIQIREFRTHIIRQLIFDVFGEVNIKSYSGNQAEDL